MSVGFTISPMPCEECGLPYLGLLAIKCPHCGHIPEPDEDVLADLNKKLGWGTE